MEHWCTEGLQLFAKKKKSLQPIVSTQKHLRARAPTVFAFKFEFDLKSFSPHLLYLKIVVQKLLKKCQFLICLDFYTSFQKS